MGSIAKYPPIRPGLTSDFSAVATTASHAQTTATAVLTRRLALGDEEAFREFHALYFDRLYQFLLVVARGQEHEARDALQETLLRVVRYARGFESEEAFWCWLKMVARSAARDGGRKRRRYWNLLQNFTLRWHQPVVSESPEDGSHLRPLLEESLAEMDSADRELIEGKYIEGASVRELSGATGLTEKAVESRLLRLRRHLRENVLKKLRSL